MATSTDHVRPVRRWCDFDMAAIRGHLEQVLLDLDDMEKR